ncbi:hypothetical protein [Alteribacillus sp. YIM 98480]|uniref:hypothetical protein n=1 Tax=Alteribacillus sp. YIM 98480 TaxID=2606599 RepID=UPI00131DC7EF|nr:hypothetical protein [Alteribacillus sp. YIM 98480]
MSNGNHNEEFRKIMQEIAAKAYPSQQVINQILEHQRQWEKVTKSFVQQVGSQVRSAIESLKPNLTRIVELANQAALTLEEFEEELAKLNYPPLSLHMSAVYIKLLRDEIKSAENEKEAEQILDEFIVNLYDNEHLDECLDMWKSFEWLQERYIIIEQIIQAHKQGLYYLSTLAVFPQIEGILAELFPEKREKNGKFSTRCIKESFREILAVENDRLDQMWDKYYVDNLLEGFKHLEPIQYLSRHALAHGADYSYGTQVNSTKSIMIMEYLFTKIEMYFINNLEDNS